MRKPVDYNPFGFKEKPIRGCPGFVMLENRMVFNSRTGLQRMPFFKGMKMYVIIYKMRVYDVLALHKKLFGTKSHLYRSHFYRELKRFEELEIVEMHRQGCEMAEIRKRFSVYNPKIEAVLQKYKDLPAIDESKILQKLTALKYEQETNEGSQGTGHHE